MGVPNVSRLSGGLSYGPSNDNTDAVQLGESRMADVATRLGIDLNSLLKANPQIKNPESLVPGQEINLPKPTPVPLRDPEPGVNPINAQTSSLPKGPVGDPIANSAVKAQLSEAVELSGKKEDYVPLNPIRPGNTNSIDMKVITEDHSVGDVHSVTHRPETNETHDSAGLEKRLSELNGGRPLTPFEKDLASRWGKQDSNTVLLPIVKIGGTGVQAYALTEGGSGDRVTTVYDRQGNVLGGPFHDEAGLVNEGLGPIDYVLVGMAAKNLIGGLLRGARGILAGEEAGAIGKAAARGESEATASGTGGSSWRQGSGTSIYNPRPGATVPKGEVEGGSSAPKGGASSSGTGEFTADELKTIKTYVEAGGDRAEIEKLLRETRGERAQVANPNSPNAGGTTRVPEWKKPGPGNKRP